MTNDFQYQAAEVIFVATVHRKLNWRDKNKDLLVRSKTIRYFFCYIVNQSTRKIITVIKAFIRLRITLASKFVSVNLSGIKFLWLSSSVGMVLKRLLVRIALLAVCFLST